MTEKQVIRVVVQSLSHVWLFVTLRTAARQAALSITISRSLFKLMSIESVMASNHLILCHPLLLLPSICPSIRVFSSELAFRIRWPKYWNFRIRSVLPKNIQDSGLTGSISLQSKGLSRVSSGTTVQKHQFLDAQPSSSIHTHTQIYRDTHVYLSVFLPICRELYFRELPPVIMGAGKSKIPKPAGRLEPQAGFMLLCWGRVSSSPENPSECSAGLQQVG